MNFYFFDEMLLEKIFLWAVSKQIFIYQGRI